MVPGETVTTLDGTSSTGFNRVWWDFTGEGPTEIRLRTKPLYSDWFPMPDEGYRVGGGGFGGGGGPIQPPGTYTVTLLVDDEEMGTQPLTVLKDPNSEGTMADIAAADRAGAGDHGRPQPGCGHGEPHRTATSADLRPAPRARGRRQRGRSDGGRRGARRSPHRGGKRADPADGYGQRRCALAIDDRGEVALPAGSGGVGGLPADGPASGSVPACY